MAVHIVTGGAVAFEADCARCRARFRYEPGDVRWSWWRGLHLDCPSCGSEHNHAHSHSVRCDCAEGYSYCPVHGARTTTEPAR